MGTESPEGKRKTRSETTYVGFHGDAGSQWSLEAILVDLECPNFRFQRGSRNAKLSRSARRSKYPSLGFSQSLFDGFLFLLRIPENFESRWAMP